MQTLDFKAEVRDRGLAEEALRLAGAEHLVTLRQTDTHFRIPDATLLRRVTTSAACDDASPAVEWLFYTRPLRITPRIAVSCAYTETAAQERFGAARPPVWLIVDKERTVWVCGDVRVHLDEVESLGRFAEIEMRVSPRRNVARCHRDIAQVRKLLSPALGEPLSCGYRDLVALEQELGQRGLPALPAGPA